MQLISPYSDSVSLRLRNFYSLTLLHTVTRRHILQKARRHHDKSWLRPLVSLRFQVLFHSAPAVLFTFPSRYYALSVAVVYLALESGLPRFKQDFTCPALLKVLYTRRHILFKVQGLSPTLVSAFPVEFFYINTLCPNFAEQLCTNSPQRALTTPVNATVYRPITH